MGVASARRTHSGRNDNVDSIVSTFTLGTIPDVFEAFQEWHVSSAAGGIARWLVEGLPPTRDRDIPSVLAQGGFEVENLETKYLAAFSKSWT
jgi:hypothetical protein